MSIKEKLREYANHSMSIQIEHVMNLEKQLKDKNKSFKEKLNLVQEKTLCEGKMQALEDVLNFLMIADKIEQKKGEYKC